MEVIYKVEEYRKMRGLSQRALALKSGVAKSTIADIESAKIHPTVFTLCKLARALNVDVRELFEYF